MLELEQVRRKSTYLEYVTAMSKLDLLANDVFGLMELDLDKCRDLSEVIDGGWAKIHNHYFIVPD